MLKLKRKTNKIKRNIFKKLENFFFFSQFGGKRLTSIIKEKKNKQANQWRLVKTSSCESNYGFQSLPSEISRINQLFFSATHMNERVVSGVLWCVQGFWLLRSAGGSRKSLVSWKVTKRFKNVRWQFCILELQAA